MVVHHTQDASVAQLAGAEKWDYVVNVDDKTVTDPIILCRYFKKLEIQKEDVRIRVGVLKCNLPLSLNSNL